MVTVCGHCVWCLRAPDKPEGLSTGSLGGGGTHTSSCHEGHEGHEALGQGLVLRMVAGEVEDLFRMMRAVLARLERQTGHAPYADRC